jgi:lactoylglutathione lyase
MSRKLSLQPAAIPLAILTFLLPFVATRLPAQGDARPAITGISHVGFFVSDLPKAVAFWDDFLGYAEPYDLKRPDGTVSIAFIKINDRQHIELFNESSQDQPGSHFSHIAFVVSNAEQMRAYLAARGVPVPARVGKGRTGDLNFEIRDPDRHLVEFVQPRATGWEAENQGKFLPPTRISDAILHVGFLVGRSQKSIAFYGGLLGFREFWRGSSNGKVLSWIDMRVPNGRNYVEFMLYQGVPAQNTWGTRNHVSLVVPDVEKAVATLEARPWYKKVYLTYAKPIEVHVGVNQQRQANLYDPDGTRVELMEPNTVTGKPTPPSTAPVPQ